MGPMVCHMTQMMKRQTARGFSETLSEGVLWETGGNEIELHSMCSYTVRLSLPQDWFKCYE